MSQSSYIAGGLLLAFVLYIAAKGRIGTYAAVLWGPTAQPVPTSGGTLSNPSTPATAAASAAGTAAKLGLSALTGSGIASGAASVVSDVLPFLGL